MTRTHTTEPSVRPPAKPSDAPRQSSTLWQRLGVKHGNMGPAFALALFSSGCAPDTSRVSGDKTNSGSFEGVAIVMMLPAQTAAQGGTPANSPAGARPALHTCFHILPGSTIDKEKNEYRCRIFEYFQDGTQWKMQANILNEMGANEGAEGICSFGPKGSATTPFRCERRSGGQNYACSAYWQSLGTNNQPASFVSVTVSDPQQAPTAAPAPVSGMSDAGTPLPTATAAGAVRGRCGGAETAALAAPLAFRLPTAEQIVASGTPVTNTPGGTASPGTVALKLNNPTTYLKDSKGQSGPLTEGTQKCLVSGTVVVRGQPVGGTLSATEQHYALTGVTVEPALSNCSLISNASTTVYLFAPHWTQ